jgi:hypothetical protein
VVKSRAMPQVSPAVRAWLCFALFVVAVVAEKLEPLVPAWTWLATVVQLASAIGLYFTEKPGTAKRIEMARAAGAAIARASSVEATDVLRGGKGL